MHHHPEAHGGRLRGGLLTESRGGVHWLFL
jgi:hypothetical protein